MTSPVVLAYFFFIFLSTVHLAPELSLLAGYSSAAGYSAVCFSALMLHPQAPAGTPWVYATWLACAASLLLAGFAAATVTRRVRMCVPMAPANIASRGKTANRQQYCEIARSIQHDLLPKTPLRIEGFDIAGWNLPADETGADCFDWLQLDDGRVAIIIADVSGHGIDSVLSMAACRAYVRAILTSTPDLRRFLSQLNELLHDDLPTGRFVTMAVALLDPEAAVLDLISAGQGPMLFYMAAENRFRSYDAQGLPLGIRPQLSYSGPQRLKFAPGDMLALVSDGLVDWTNAEGESFGQNRLKQLITANRHLPAAAIVSELYSEARNFVNRSPQVDDLTVLLVKRL